MAKAIIKRVLLSEKGAKLAALNQYFLEVDTKASKPEIRQAVEAKFGVHVLAVTESTWKRAIVTVKAGERIETL